MADSIFTKIINREIPGHFVYEDELVVGLLDINPVHKGHTLIIAKTPFENAFDGDPEVLAHMMKVGQMVAKALQSGLKADGVNLFMNNGEAANQEVPHAHLHVVPRFSGDGSFTPPTHETYEAESEKETVATQIVAALED